MTRVRGDHDIGVAWFSVDTGGNGAVVITENEYVEKGKFVFDFFFPGELDSGVDAAETFIKIRCWFAAAAVDGAEACAEELAGGDGAVDVVHVAEEVVWDGFVLLSSLSDGFVDGVVHPYLGDGDHKAKANRSRVFGRVVTIVENEIRGLEAEVKEFGDLGR